MQRGPRRAIGTFFGIDASDGELLAHAAVTDWTSIIGYSVTISMNSWWATIWRHGFQPTAIEVTVEVDALEVVQAHGPLVTLPALEKLLARLHALQALAAGRHTQIVFVTYDIFRRADGYRLVGALQIRGESRGCAIYLRVKDHGDTWRMSAQFDLQLSDFGVKPPYLLRGPMRVGDHVTVSFAADLAKDVWAK